MRLGVGNQVRASPKFPFAPRCDYFDVRLQSVVGEFKSNLIVAFAGRAVGNCVSVFFARDFDLVFRDYRTRQ